ncbi:acid phosphatase 1-like protein [Tanacetum coccineum]
MCLFGVLREEYKSCKMSIVSYYKKHEYGGEALNKTALEEWMSKGNCTVMEYTLGLYNTIKKGGIQIILVSSRKEHLRDATIDNLDDAGYYGWKILYLRCLVDFVSIIFVGSFFLFRVQSLTVQPEGAYGCILGVSFQFGDEMKNLSLFLQQKTTEDGTRCTSADDHNSIKI